MATLPADILASGFTTEINRRRERFKEKIIGWIKDGKLSQLEMKQLNELGKKLGISHTDARLMILEARNEIKIASHMNCPHCGSDIQVYHSPEKVKLK